LRAPLRAIDAKRGRPAGGLRPPPARPLSTKRGRPAGGLRPPPARPLSIDVAIRTGDTPQRDRAAMRRHPPDVLITTPESLYLMLTSQAREILTGTEWVI